MNLIWNKVLGVNIYFSYKSSNTSLSGISQTDWRQYEKQMNILNKRYASLLHIISIKRKFKHRQINEASISLHIWTLATLIPALQMQTHSVERMLN